MPLYIADYLSATEHLDAAHSGAYLHLIMHYWQKGNLPQEDKFLARIARMTARQWAAAKPTLQAFFSDGWKHERIDFELCHAHIKSEARAESGARGGRAKALKDKKAKIAKATNLPQRTDSKTGGETLPSSSESTIEELASASSTPPPKETPKKVLLECLSEETAEGVIEHRRKLRAPLTVLAARGLVKGFNSTADPEDAARTMVARGWRGFELEWYEKHRNSGNERSSGRSSLVSAGLNLIRKLDEQAAGSVRSEAGGSPGDWHARLLPTP